MAIVTTDQQKTTLTETEDIVAFLAPHGVVFEHWPIPETIAKTITKTSLSDGEKSAILDGFRGKLDELARTQGYVEADIVALEPTTPGLEEALAKFDKEHFHTDDEVRYIIDGRGIFGFVTDQGHRFEIEVQRGEYIVIPKNAWHWFTLCEDRRIKAIRIFKDKSGWVPHYRNGSAA